MLFQNTSSGQQPFDYAYPRPKNDEEKRNLKIKSLTDSKKKQADYENGTKEQKEEIFLLAYNDLFQMINDTYNNYVVQKIFEIGILLFFFLTNKIINFNFKKGEIQHKKALFERLKDVNFLEIATHKFGCRVIQKTIEAFPEAFSPEFQYLRNIIFHFLTDLIKNENGSLVVQKCLERYSSEDFIFILSYITNNVNILFFIISLLNLIKVQKPCL